MDTSSAPAAYDPLRNRAIGSIRAIRPAVGSEDEEMSTDIAAGAGSGQATRDRIGGDRIGGDGGRHAPRLFPWREVVLPWLASRVLADGLILGFARARARPALYGGFARWDGGWYVQIARHGYGPAPIHGHESAWPFFPLLPAGMHVLGRLGIPEAAGGVLLNHVAFLVALAGIYRIAIRHVSPTGGRLAVWAIALFPGSFLFSMVYPSAIFVAASVWAFALVEEHRDVAAGIAAIAAVMVRPNGFVVAIALAFALRWSWRRLWIVCAPSAAFFLGWCLYNLDRTGDALTFWSAKAGWPEVTALDFLNKLHKYAIPHVALALAAVAAAVVMWRKLPRSWLVLTALYLVPPLFIGIVGLGRYATECFPPFVAAGELLARMRRGTIVALFGASIAAEALCAYWVIYSKWLP